MNRDMVRDSGSGQNATSEPWMKRTVCERAASLFLAVATVMRELFSFHPILFAA